MSNVDYCICRGTIGYAGKNRHYDSWEPFIERDHHIVWRQRHHVHQHLFAYKGVLLAMKVVLLLCHEDQYSYKEYSYNCKLHHLCTFSDSSQV